MTEPPAISVIVPCRNERGTLTQCLEALRAQDFPRDRVEILVVDGGSTDGSDRIAREYGVRLLQDPGKGPGAARNLGVRAAKGDVVAFTDADCIALPGWLASIAEIFAGADATFGGVAGGMRMPRDTLLGRLEDNDAIVHYRGFITSNVAYRRDVLSEVGGFDETLCCAEDYDLASRVMDAGYRVIHDPRPQVVHAPPEVAGSVGPYLLKQFWYARNDMPAQARALRRALLDGPGAAPGSVASLLTTAESVAFGGLAAAAIAGVAFRAPAAAMAATLGAAAVATWRTRRAAVESGNSLRELVPMSAVATAKVLVRGVGTLAGLAEMVRPSRWVYLKRQPVISVGPRATWPSRPLPSATAASAAVR